MVPQPSDAVTTSPSCSRCGEPVRPGARFCMKCGADVSGEQGGVATAMMRSADDRSATEAALEQLRQATMGEYEILSELGRGGMASVYLAHEIALDRKVAIKVMAPALLLMGEGMTERFKREARTAASLSHPNIIPIHAVKSQGRTLYFVMKFIAGRSLESIIRDVGALPIPMVRALLHQVGGALGYAHRRNIVHRDVKPANIMVEEEGWAVVTDFGIAKVAEAKGLTMTGVAVGTPAYMSPEQCGAKEITGKSDQYSLGVVAYEMLTGKQPFDADSAMAIMFAHFNEQPAAIQEKRPDCPPELAAAVMRMLEKAPDARWPNMEDALAAIGGKPLSHDDPVQKQLVALVKKGSTRRILEAVPPPPTSPIPGQRREYPPTKPIEKGPAVVAVAVSPATSSIHVGDPMQLTATPRGTGGTEAGGVVSWSTSNPAVATVSSSGLVSAIAPGTAMIMAAAGGVVGTATVTVTPVPVASITIAPVKGDLRPGGMIQLSAVARDVHQSELRGRVIAWTSGAPAVATVNSEGLLTAVAEGSAIITASSEAISATVTIKVAPVPVASLRVESPARPLIPGATQQLVATALDAKGTTLKGRKVVWSSAAPAVAAVEPGGLAVAISEGSAAVTASCEGITSTVTIAVAPVPVASVSIEPQEQHLVAGASARLSATARDAQGAALKGRAVSWASSAPAIVSVNPEGQVKALAEGQARITATSEKASGTALVTVAPAPVASLTLQPASLRVTVGQSGMLAVEARDGSGAALTGRKITWTSSDPRVATVNAEGRVSAVAAGSASIKVECESQRATASVTVLVPTPAPAPRAPEPAAALAEAATVKIPATPAPHPISRPIPAPARVPTAPKGGPAKIVIAGLSVLLLGAGAWWFATHRSPPATATNETSESTGPKPPPPPPAPVGSVVLSTPPAVIPVGRTIQLMAMVRDAAGAELAGRTTTWSSSDSSVARVSPAGAVSAVKPGTAGITATSGEKSATVSISVAAQTAGETGPTPVATLTIGSIPKSLEAGGTAQLTALVKDAKGTALTDRTVVWSSSDNRIATVAANGTLTAVGAGSATITASSEGKSVTAAVVVTPVPVAQVTVTPASSNVGVGLTAQLTAAALDAHHASLSDRAASWSSSDSKVATVSSSGLVSGVAPGSATITASLEGKSGTASITVPATVLPVSAIVLTAASKALKVGETTQLEAEVKDAKGGVLAGRSVTWASSNPKVATVSSSGLVSAVADGSAEITATSESKSAAVSLTVSRAAATPAPVASIVISPAPTKPLKPGDTEQLTASARDAKENPLGDRVVTWSSANPGIVKVSSTGLVTAVAVGSTEITAASEGKSAAVSVTVATPSGPPAPPPGPVAASANLPRKGLSAGGLHSCGLLANGGVTCWGAGQSQPSPVGVSGAAMVVVGTGFGCALASGGSVLCWGENKFGELGDGSKAPHVSPAPIAGGLVFTQITASGHHACGLTSAGKAYCWGQNDKGQVGDGSTSDRTKPVPVSRGFTYATISAGGGHTCALTSAGKAYCWGDGWSGALGYGPRGGESEPVEVKGDLKFSHISTGRAHTCAVANGGKAYCWGENGAGQLGNGATEEQDAPEPVAGSLAFEDIAAGGTHTCGLTSAGEAYCWGEGRYGQLGDGARKDRNKPAAVSGGFKFTAITTGAAHTCGVTGDQQALCWGGNAQGQLGDGGTEPRPTPGPVGSAP